jgi:phage replication O-like protein O
MKKPSTHSQCKVEKQHFNGFEPSNTTPVPDVLFDELLADLSGSELKVLMYIIRRTRGFKKDSDAISLTQFEKGIVTSDGRILDRGCGLNRETICKALKSLEERGCIKSDKRTNHQGDSDITVYSIRFKGEVVGKSDQGSRKIRPG